MPRKKSARVHRDVEQLLLAPKSKDVLDDEGDGTAAKTGKDSDDDYEDDNDNDDVLGLGMGGGVAFDFAQERSSLRGRNTGTLEETDKKYAGKKVSRKELGMEKDLDWKEQESAEWGDMLMGGEGDEEEEDGEEGEEDQEDSDEQEVESEEEAEEEELEGEEEEQDDDDEEEEGDEFGDDDDIDIGGLNVSNDGSEEDMDADDEEKEEPDGIQLVHRTDVAKEVAKGKAIKQQLLVSERLLECRIQMQKMLSKVNQLPQHETFKEFKSAGDEQHRRALKRTQNGLKGVLDDLLSLQTDMINGNCAVKGVMQDDDEEEEEEIEPCAKKMKVNEYSDVLSSRSESLRPWRDATIQLWNEKTRLATSVTSNKSFSGFESSTLKQIEHILSDKDRLYKRSRTKRSAYRVLGKADTAETGKGQDESDEPLQQQQASQFEVDEEIFDDDDFYHQLLRDLIDRKAADSGQLGEQWQQIQKMRSKLKRKVDTRASKGRKTRYDIHAKLVNFMAPVYVDSWADETKNELFGCLFGKND